MNLMWWLVLYAVVGVLVMFKAGASLKSASKSDTMLNVFVRIISVICWPVMVLAALSMTISDVRKKEDKVE